MRRSYSEMRALRTIEERFDYLVLRGSVGHETFGHARSLNQEFYTSYRWKRARRMVIIRDSSCDLGIPGYEIHSDLYVHHMNPMTVDDIINDNPDNYDPEFLVTTSLSTHNAIHFGDSNQLPTVYTERRPGDTWP